jgi:DNA-binding Xre family transcriptional regulator
MIAMQKSLDDWCRDAGIPIVELMRRSGLDQRTITKMRRSEPVKSLKADKVCKVLSSLLPKEIKTEDVSTIKLL